VRDDSGYGAYYKEIFYFPENNNDLTVVKLPCYAPVCYAMSRKAIRHDYYTDGQLKKLTIYPSWPSASGKREIDYEYDIAGNIKEITKGGLSEDDLTYASYTYNPNNSIKSVDFGIYQNTTTVPGISYTTQSLDYTYDSRGMLSKIGDPDLVTSTLNGGSQNPHFGTEIIYNTATDGYYNGRVLNQRTCNSSTSSVTTNAVVRKCKPSKRCT
jgi:hypothetical protein